MGVVILILLYVCFAKWLAYRQKRKNEADEEAQTNSALVDARYNNVGLLQLFYFSYLCLGLQLKLMQGWSFEVKV